MVNPILGWWIYQPCMAALGMVSCWICHINCRIESIPFWGGMTSYFEFHQGRPSSLQNLRMTQVWSCRGVVPGNFAHQGLLRTMRAAPAWRSRSWCRSHKLRHVFLDPTYAIFCDSFPCFFRLSNANPCWWTSEECQRWFRRPWFSLSASTCYVFWRTANQYLDPMWIEICATNSMGLERGRSLALGKTGAICLSKAEPFKKCLPTESSKQGAEAVACSATWEHN